MSGCGRSDQTDGQSLFGLGEFPLDHQKLDFLQEIQGEPPSNNRRETASLLNKVTVHLLQGRSGCNDLFWHPSTKLASVGVKETLWSQIGPEVRMELAPILKNTPTVPKKRVFWGQVGCAAWISPMHLMIFHLPKAAFHCSLFVEHASAHVYS